MKFLHYLSIFSFLLISVSCGGDDDVSSLSISDYVSQNNLNTTVTASGLNYVINNPGTGLMPTSASTVTVNYRGYFLNGETFDSGDNITFPLSNVIRGWTEGLQLISEGGSITLLIPSNLAYGTFGQGSIPPNTNIAFDVDLLAVN